MTPFVLRYPMVSHSPIFSQVASLKAMKTVKQLWQTYLNNPNQSAVMDISKSESGNLCQNVIIGIRDACFWSIERLQRTTTHSSVVIKHTGDSRVYHFQLIQNMAMYHP